MKYRIQVVDVLTLVPIIDEYIIGRENALKRFNQYTRFFADGEYTVLMLDA